jgi:Cof subfamily protein (haloacid dehalogenase superfamily)
MSIRMIAIDIDGTLMRSAGVEISGRNRDALLAAEAAGIEIVIATGRREAYAMPLIAQLGLSGNSVMISSNGAVVRGFDGSLIKRHFLPASTARRLSGELRGFGTLVFTFDRQGAGSLVVEDVEQLHARIQRWVEANRPYLLEVRPIESAFDADELPIQGMVCGTVSQMRQAEAQLRALPVASEISMHRTEYEARDLGILDLLPRGCSKGTAVARLASIRNLQPQEIMAIGDNLNDLEMLEYAGRGVVMANACEEILDIARDRGWERTVTNDEDGVAWVIEAMLQEPAFRQNISADVSTPISPAKLPDSNGSSAGSQDDPKDTIAGWVR